MKKNIKNIILTYYLIGLITRTIPLLISGILTIIYGILIDQKCYGINGVSINIAIIVLGIIELSFLIIHLIMYYGYMCSEIKTKMENKIGGIRIMIRSFWIMMVIVPNIIGIILFIWIGSIIECKNKHVNIWFMVNGIANSIYVVFISILFLWLTQKYFGSVSSKKKSSLLKAIMLSIAMFYNIFLLLWNIGMIII